MRLSPGARMGWIALRGVLGAVRGNERLKELQRDTDEEIQTEREVTELTRTALGGVTEREVRCYQVEGACKLCEELEICIEYSKHVYTRKYGANLQVLAACWALRPSRWTGRALEYLSGPSRPWPS
jgi:hypothetical protein